MKTKTGISLGSIYKLSPNICDKSKLLDICETLPINSVEFSFNDHTNINDLYLSPNNINYLNSLDYISFHLPSIKNLSEIELNKLSDNLDILTKMIDIDNFVIHPNAIGDNIDFIKQYKNNVLIENLSKETEYGYYNFLAFMEMHSYFNVCIDTSHALSWGELEIVKYMHAFKDKVKQFHVSSFTNGEDHSHIHFAPIKTVYCVADYLSEFKDVPAIIETIPYDSNVVLELLEKDIDYVKRLRGDR